jgi:dienelactone hydrolase
MLVERTHYFAKPGLAAEVLRTRRRASAVREALGLPRGTILAKAEPAGEGPDVTWECAFPGAAAHALDLAARDRSPEFGAVRAAMTALLARFERLVLEVRDAGAGAAAADLDGLAVVPETVRIPAGGHDLAGYLFRPPTPGPAPAVVVSHGSTIQPGTSDRCRPGLAALLASWGYAALLPHRRGYGDSPGPPWRSEVPGELGSPEYDRALAARLGREADDVVAAAGWLGGRPEVAPGRIALLGSSFGGTVSLLAAARTDGLRCAVDFAGAAMNWERTPTLRAAMLEAARGARVPLCLVQAANDHSTAPTRELGAELARLGKPHEAVVFPPFGLSAEEGHLFAWTGAPVWGRTVRAFLARWLDGDA